MDNYAISYGAPPARPASQEAAVELPPAAVSVFLTERLEKARERMGPPRATDAHAEMFRDIDALRRVIALLEEK